MALVQDILLNDEDDLLIANGDFLVGYSDEQHLALITIMDLGHLKENPFLGIGINRKLGSSENPNVIKSISKQMYEADNYVVKSITMSGSLIENVDAERL
ncbi:hypothetical protein UFOVP87_4 [uncultured Caudovirales phage]|uniref:Uncharacterized protein n=1 Tax=uncultured Caudovirales phage TaxID=2100421 RepID=A0A6J5KX97_9CAUD|nr:hypothetical protein UFOVP87_4 [uncultured Caudovirales phage]